MIDNAPLMSMGGQVFVVYIAKQKKKKIKTSKQTKHPPPKKNPKQNKQKTNHVSGMF
jgi:hypothetical protein